MDPAIEGTTVTFECPPEYILIGPNTTTCMGNGEWKPDPRDVECKGIYNIIHCICMLLIMRRDLGVGGYVHV